MDAKYYCDSMQAELTATRARIYSIMRELERIPAENRGAATKGIAAMNQLVDEITDRISKLRTECPVDWAPAKDQIEIMKLDLQAKMDLWDAEHIAGGYVGG